MGVSRKELMGSAIMELRSKTDDYENELKELQNTQKNQEESTTVLFAFLKNISNGLKEPLIEELLKRNNQKLQDLEQRTKDTIDEISEEYKKGKSLQKQQLKELNMTDKHIEQIIDFSEAVSSDSLMSPLITQLLDKLNEETRNKDNDNEVEKHKNKHSNSNENKHSQNQRKMIKNR